MRTYGEGLREYRSAASRAALIGVEVAAPRRLVASHLYLAAWAVALALLLYG